MVSPEFIAGAALALQGYTLRQIVGLKEDVASIKATCRARNECAHGEHNTTNEGKGIELVKERRKRTMRFMGAVAVLAALAWLLTGCGTVGGAFTRGEAVHAVTNTVPTVTVTTTQPPPTLENPNPAPVVVTNTILREVVSVVTNEVYAVNPGVGEVIATGRAIAGVIPSPYSPLIDSGFALAAGLLAALAGWKTRAASLAGNKAALADAMLKAAIAGVETVGDAATKQAIANNAAAAGVYPQLDAKVQGVASYVTPPAKGG